MCFDVRETPLFGGGVNAPPFFGGVFLPLCGMDSCLNPVFCGEFLTPSVGWRVPLFVVRCTSLPRSEVCSSPPRLFVGFLSSSLVWWEITGGRGSSRRVGAHHLSFQLWRRSRRSRVLVVPTWTDNRGNGAALNRLMTRFPASAVLMELSSCMKRMAVKVQVEWVVTSIR